MMMSIETFLMLLLTVSILTGLVTEGIKKLADEAGETYKPNLLAGGVAVVLSAFVSVGYLILTETKFTDKMAVVLIALILLSWLCSMLGYDKVIQSIMQIKNHQNPEQKE